MEYNTEINITDNLAQRFVEQGFTIKEGETRSFILTKCDDTLTDDLISTYDERETTKVIYAWNNKRTLWLLYYICFGVLVDCCFILLDSFINR